MPFISEEVSPEIREKYHLDEAVRPHISDWTVDYDGDVWLCLHRRLVDRDAGMDLGLSYWVFSWQGHAMRVELKFISMVSEAQKRLSCVYRLLKIDIPAALEAQRAPILEGLEAALTTYKDAGIYSKVSEYILRLEIPEALQ